MENTFDFQTQDSRQIDQYPEGKQSSNANYLAIGLTALICSLVFGFGGYYLGRQYSDSQPIIIEEKVTISPSPTPSIANPVVKVSTSKLPETSCISTFTSKYLKLSFKYDSCAWKLSEELITPESGIYSTIKASHSSNYQVMVRANTMGMGGNYPDCYQVDDVFLIENDVVRVHLVNSPLGVDGGSKYLYLNSKNEYAIKGYSGDFGDEKFNEYFTFLNPESFKNSNMCWRNGGINPVAVVHPKEGSTESYEINKDIEVLIEEENVTDEQFLTDADALTVGVYSGMNE